MTRLTILLLFGGESSEHDVSMNSARNIYAAMDGKKYDTKLCYIDRQGKWWLLDEWTETLSRHGGVQLLAAPGSGSFMTIPGSVILHVDVIFPALHGKNGEDGTIQGLAALLHIPIVGCDTTASALCMDKVLTKRVLSSCGIKTSKFRVHRVGEQMPNYEDVAGELGEVFFVKPACSGSSIGVSKVHTVQEFIPAVKAALDQDDQVLIEEYIDGRELEVAVIGNFPKQQVSGVGEIIIASDFYDYDAKYDDASSAQTLTNIELPSEIEDKIRSVAKNTFEALGCRGIARIDFLLRGTTPYVLEVNTLPGFTNISMYPKLWREAGISYAELVDTLIESALKVQA